VGKGKRMGDNTWKKEKGIIHSKMKKERRKGNIRMGEGKNMQKWGEKKESRYSRGNWVETWSGGEEHKSCKNMKKT